MGRGTRSLKQNRGEIPALTSVSHFFAPRLGSWITHIATRIEKGLPLEMEECPDLQIMSVACAHENLMEQSSILLEMCGNSEILPLAQENLARPYQCLDQVNVIEYQVVEEPEYVQQPQQSEEIVWAVVDPELIRLAEECSVTNTVNTWSEETSVGEQNPNFEDLFKRNNRQSQDKLGDAEWIPHHQEQNQKSSLSTSKSRVNMRNKHRKGRSRKPLEEIDDKAKKKNVVRCRNYRFEKKVREEKKLSDLQELEKRNIELKRKEVEVRGKREKVQNAYLALIKYGRIKFALGF